MAKHRLNLQKSEVENSEPTRKQSIVRIIMVYASLFIILIITIFSLYKSSINSYFASLDKEMQTIEQNMAIEQLCECRGMIKEIELLDYSECPDEILLNELKEIASNGFSISYLKEFTFTFPKSDDIQLICQSLTEQINSQVQTLELDTL